MSAPFRLANEIDITGFGDTGMRLGDLDGDGELFTQILDIWAEEIPIVGYLGQSPAPIIMKDTMHNYISGQPVNDGLEDEHFLNPQLLFWEDPENHI